MALIISLCRAHCATGASVIGVINLLFLIEVRNVQVHALQSSRGGIISNLVSVGQADNMPKSEFSIYLYQKAVQASS